MTLKHIEISSAPSSCRVRFGRVAGLFVAVMLSFVCPAAVQAFTLDTYTDTSVLASGRWVKVSIPKSGVYAVSRATLRSWGFSDPSKVRVHGYGAGRISDNLTVDNYTDDLPVVQSFVTDAGSLVFYGVGPEKQVTAASNRFFYENNIYTDRGYYYLGESDVEIPAIPSVGRPEASGPAEVFNECVQHEEDLVSPGEAGPFLVGEDFRFTPRRTFTLRMPGRVAETDVWMQCSFVARTLSGTSSVAFTANGTAVESNSSDRIPATTNDNYSHGREGLARHTMKGISGESLSLEIRHSASTTVSGAWLNYVAVNYTRALDMASAPSLSFSLQGTSARLSGATAKTLVWDVTDPASVLAMETSAPDAGGALVWTNSYTGRRSYVAFRTDAVLPAPSFAGTVANRNLHGIDCADMVIFTARAWKQQSEAIADIHRAEGLTVHVVDVDLVYDEFGSGSPDVGALRRFLKMLYDRGKVSGPELKYVLLAGRATYDPRHLTASMRNAAQTVPQWLGGTMSQSLSDNDGYGTDDVLAMLEDGSGSDFGLDFMSVAVGRLPFTSASMAQNYVDKLKQYIDRSARSGWRNRILALADDEDQGNHIMQMERMLGALEEDADNAYIVDKVYMDAYDYINGNYPQAREDMFRYLDEGSAWWMFIGHANNHSMTHDGQLTYSDINNRMFFKRLPVLFASTCDFLRWDSATESGGEILLNERNGGAIAMISATRPVYIYDNGLLSAAVGRALGKRLSEGSRYRIGDVYRAAKNDVQEFDRDGKPAGRVRNVNRLRYVLMADPAMRLPIPDNNVQLTHIDGKPVDPENPPVIAARRSVVLSGVVTDHAGRRMSDFNGTLSATIYDAEFSTTSNGRGKGKEMTFEQHGKKLSAGSAPVADGEFTLKLNMPSEIADNYRPATVSLYAVSDGNKAEAAGLSRDLYVYGIDEGVPTDTVAPDIESFYLNHATFRSGDAVNPSPMAIAAVSDNVAINLSSAGIGHQLQLVLDGKQTFNDVAQYYTPAADGSAGGTINYPLADVSEGSHMLTLRVWDTDGNATSSTIDFVVSPSLAPKIYDIWTDANPASVSANFYISHDRPDQMCTVTVSVYNLLGAPVWSKTLTGLSDMFLSTPVEWNLCDSSGLRVNRGIYLYRATITTDGESFSTGSRRIAVTN